MNRDDLIREIRVSGASWPALVGLYALLLGAMVMLGTSIT